MKRYCLTGMLDARGIEPDPEGFLVLWADVLAALEAGCTCGQCKDHCQDRRVLADLITDHQEEVPHA